MNDLIKTPEVILFFSLVPALMGFFVLVWGRSLARKGDWLIGLSLALAFIGLCVGGVSLWQAGLKPEVWHRGWIWPRAETGAITVGVVLDAAGFVVSVVALLVAFVFLAQWKIFNQEPRAERIYAGLGLAFSGVCLSWISLTPWLAVAGLALAVFGGFVALGSRWNHDSDAATAIRFALERVSGLFLVILGACGLAATRLALGWEPGAIPENMKQYADFTGAFLLVSGVFIQFQPFPFLGWLNSPTESLISVRAVMAQLAPAMASFALLFRMEPYLKSTGVFPGFGWVLLTSAGLALGSGLLQSRWRVSFGAWISVGLSIAAAILAFTGQDGGLPLFMGVFLGGSVMALAASVLETSEEPHGEIGVLRAKWTKGIGFLGVSAATGILGFVSIADFIHWIGDFWNQPGQATVNLIIIFLYTVLGWKLAWRLARSERQVQLGWLAIGSPLLLVFLSLGIFWTGTITGGAFPGVTDQILPSVLVRFFGELKDGAEDRSYLTLVSLVLIGLSLVAIATAYWLARKAPWLSKKPGLMELKELIAGGYGVDKFARYGFEGMVALGRVFERMVDLKIWSQWVPDGFSFVIRRVSSVMVVVDSGVSERLVSVLRNGIDLPARALQLLQNGDVQWYLLFAVASGVAIFFHFWKF
jgi:hypothetical protein